MSVVEAYRAMSYGPAPESDAPARAWLDSHGRKFGHFIGGEWTSAEGENFATIDPATGQPLATARQGTAAEIDQAVAAAEAALPRWRALGDHGRAKLLYAMARQLQKHSRRFAVLETLDSGKPIRESRDLDIPLAIRHFYHHAGWAQLLGAEFPGQTGYGVVGQIIPWNFPLLMLAWKVAPALAAGNTVVLKPAEETPLTALAFADLVSEIGLPPGVLNILTGDGATGEALVRHARVQKIAFTGSTEVGRAIRRATAATDKGLGLELGGKSPFIVCEDADLDGAVEGLVDGIFFNQGEVCCAGSRLLVQERVKAPLLDRLRRRMETLRVGAPLDKSTDIGAIISTRQRDRIAGLVATGVAEGAVCWQPSRALPTDGLYFPPTLLTEVAPASTVAQTEIFGPVLTVTSFRTLGEAIELANNTVYGLAASVWSESLSTALSLAHQVKAGVVWVNSANQFDAAAPFGGVKESGFGREGGREGIAAYLKAATEPTTWVAPPSPNATGAQDSIDRTPKLYIGGKQARPDGGESFATVGGTAPLGNRKDIRNAVEAARAAAPGWARTSGHGRAQILYYLAENLSARARDFAARLDLIDGADGDAEVALSIERLFTAAAWADKIGGTVVSPPGRVTTLAVTEPVGVIGVVCPPEAPLLAFVSLLAPGIAMGNTIVIVPSDHHPLVATDFYQLLDTSDVPAGVVNIVTGRAPELARVLADHADVDAVWGFGDETLSGQIKTASAANLKRVWTNEGRSVGWTNPTIVREAIRHATQTKTMWLPHGG